MRTPIYKELERVSFVGTDKQYCDWVIVKIFKNIFWIKYGIAYHINERDEDWKLLYVSCYYKEVYEKNIFNIVLPDNDFQDNDTN